MHIIRSYYHLVARRQWMEKKTYLLATPDAVINEWYHELLLVYYLLDHVYSVAKNCCTSIEHFSIYCRYATKRKSMLPSLYYWNVSTTNVQTKMKQFILVIRYIFELTNGNTPYEWMMPLFWNIVSLFSRVSINIEQRQTSYRNSLSRVGLLVH